MFKPALLVICLPLALGINLACLDQGECQFGNNVGDISTYDVDHCLEYCQETEGCEYFTFDEENELCIAYDTCRQLSTQFCSNCVSGEKKECSYCFSPGQCIGPVISSAYASDRETCLNRCQEITSCEWFTFHDSDNACILSTECTFIDETCQDDCFYGSATCKLQQPKPDSTLVMVIGGYGDEANRDAEFLDFAGNHSCAKPPRLPAPLSQSFGAQVANKVIVCGGIYTSQCYNYDFESNDWSRAGYLPRSLQIPSTVLLDEDTWWITGGSNSVDGIVADTLIYYNNEFHPGPQLPYPSELHCLLRLNDTHTFMAGGLGVYATSQAHVYNFETNEWTRLADMRYTRYEHGCGIAGDNVVVTGGFATPSTEIYSLSKGTWSEGPTPPTENGFWTHMATPYQFEDTFAIIGGQGGIDEEELTSVFQFDLENLAWVERNERLFTGRSFHVVIPIDDSLAQC